MSIHKVWGFILSSIFVFSSITYAATYSGGDGSQANPYQIASKADLLKMGVATEDYDKCFILIADIDLAGHTFTVAPIASDRDSTTGGFQGTPFIGSFDGRGRMILNMKINANTNYYKGLFGLLGSGAIVKNLNIKNAVVNQGVSYTGILAGDSYAEVISCVISGTISTEYSSSCHGGMIGYNRGTLSNCRASVNIAGNDSTGGLVGYNQGTIVFCSCEGGNVKGNMYGGGLVGYNIGIITNCYSVNVVNSNYDTGGLVGCNYGFIENSYSTGNVKGLGSAGGLVAENAGGVYNCFSTGKVTGVSSASGGLIGQQNYHANATVQNSFWDTQTSGYNTSFGGIGKTTSQMKDSATFLAAGWDFNDESANGLHNLWMMLPDSYPVISYFNGYLPPQFNGAGTEDSPYIIANESELGMIMYYPRACYVLVNDIDLTGITWNQSVIRYFNGKFDGQNHKITNLTIHGDNYVGLFGRVYSGGQIKNLEIKDCVISGDKFVGGVAGLLLSGVVSESRVSGAISGVQYIGGIAGMNGTSVSGLGNYGRLQSQDYGCILNCCVDGIITGTDREIGGIAGQNTGFISCCYSSGRCSGGSNVGGLVGHTGHGIVANSYSLCKIGGIYSGGICGVASYYASVYNCYYINPRNGNDVDAIGDQLGSGCKGILRFYEGEQVSSSVFLDSGWDVVGEQENGTCDYWIIEEGSCPEWHCRI